MASTTTTTTLVVIATIATAIVATATASTCGSGEGCDLFRCRFVYVNYLAAEMQSLASQRMVEVHYHDIILHFQYRAVHTVAIRIHHWDGITFLDHLGVEFTVHLEDILRKIQYVLLVIFAISLGWLDGEVERATYFQPVQGFLECRKHHACSVDEFQRSLDRRFFH